ncbi:MAG: ACP phosphodiesterase [Bacteroidota bacterium]|nr:ACP phosphodiesterase [Bacteroidota bacterium]
MNYLAHLFLSGSEDPIIIGNFIADHVKGRQIDHIDKEISKGIHMHRAIDAFTDTHHIVLQTKDRLRHTQSKYTPVVADVFMDHFLASKFDEFSPTPLDIFADNVFQILKANENMLPLRTQNMLVYMQNENWLTAYRTIAGMDFILKAMSRRTNFPSNMATAADDLERDYLFYEKDFEVFFPQLQAFCKDYLKNI